jgi:hypothetical protein
MTKAKSVLAVLVLFVLPTLYFSASPPSTKTAASGGQTDAPEAVERYQIVTGLAAAIGRSKVALPAWALDAANEAVMHWKLHRLEGRTAEIEKEVVAVLRIVAGLEREVAAGRALSAREMQLARQRLDAHGRRLGDLASRVDAVARGAQEANARIARLEADNAALAAQNAALQASNAELRRRVLADRCGAGRKRGPRGCVDDPR